MNVSRPETEFDSIETLDSERKSGFTQLAQKTIRATFWVFGEIALFFEYIESFFDGFSGLGELPHLEGVVPLNLLEGEPFSFELFSGGIPQKTGYQTLSLMGVTSVITLRGVSAAKKTAEDAGLKYIHIPMNPFTPDEHSVIAFLKALVVRRDTPAYMYSHLATLRTAFMCAVYQIVCRGVQKETAIAQFVSHTKGWGSFFTREHIHYLRSLNVDALMHKLSDSTEKKELS